MNTKQLILISFIGLLCFFLIIPVVEARLVPCGPGVDIECEFCHIFVILWRAVNFILFTIVPPLATLIIIFAGFKYYHAAATNPEEANKVKGIIISIVIGIFVLFGGLGFLRMFTEHIGSIPIYSYVENIIFGYDSDYDDYDIRPCPVPEGFW